MVFIAWGIRFGLYFLGIVSAGYDGGQFWPSQCSAALLTAFCRCFVLCGKEAENLQPGDEIYGLFRGNVDIACSFAPFLLL